MMQTMRSALLVVSAAVCTALGMAAACSSPSDVDTYTPTTGTAGAAAAGGSSGGGTDPGGSSTSATGQGGSGGEAPPADYRAPGPYAVTQSQGSFETSNGCILDYDLFAAESSPWDGIVVTAHGFGCGRMHMADWARHWASWGLTTVAPDLCHSSTYDLDQEQNGHDIVELAGELSTGPAVYTGHSAGGLAALVAAANDPATLGSFGLDPVDWLTIGSTAADAMTTPAYGLVGIPVNCNAYNNALPLYAGMDDARLLRVVEADHCDFSNPNTCTPCQVGCGVGTNLLFTNEELTATIGELSAAFLVWVTGLDSAGADWWAEGGAGYDHLSDEGAILEP